MISSEDTGVGMITKDQFTVTVREKTVEITVYVDGISKFLELVLQETPMDQMTATVIGRNISRLASFTSADQYKGVSFEIESPKAVAWATRLTERFMLC